MTLDEARKVAKIASYSGLWMGWDQPYSARLVSACHSWSAW